MKKKHQDRWIGWALFLAILICIVLIAQGCETSSTPATPAEVRSSLVFSVEGITYQGYAVVQRKTSQKIQVSVPDKAARLIFRSCHREDVITNPPRVWETTFVPVMFLENWGSCLVTFSVITQKGNLLTGHLDFSSNETLKATSYCNGKKQDFPLGASFCEGRTGLAQKIDFAASNVVSLGSKGCPEMKKDGYYFTYSLGKGLCIYAFRDTNGGTHRLTTRGYDTLEVE